MAAAGPAEAVELEAAARIGAFDIAGVRAGAALSPSFRLGAEASLLLSRQLDAQGNTLGWSKGMMSSVFVHVAPLTSEVGQRFYTGAQGTVSVVDTQDGPRPWFGVVLGYRHGLSESLYLFGEVVGLWGVEGDTQGGLKLVYPMPFPFVRVGLGKRF